MKVCPECKARYSDPGLERCPNDEAWLEDDAESNEPDPLIGQTISGRFTITEFLGAGGMGTVYKAVQAHIDRVVALKVLRPDLAASEHTVARFRREAKAASRLKSPHTVTLFDFGQDDDLLFLAMEFMEGETLTEHYCRKGVYSWREALGIGRQVAESLQEAHEIGIVHRDLKPDNIFLDTVGGRPTAKVLDFGIARMIQTGEDAQQTLTQEGTVFGTPGYMSPEQARGRRVDHRSDLYSLGVVLFEMLSGEPLFEAESIVMLMSMHITEPVPNLSDRNPEIEVPLPVEVLISRLLAKDPDHRFQSAAELIEAIDRALSESESTTPSSGELWSSSDDEDDPPGSDAFVMAATSPMQGVAPVSGSGAIARASSPSIGTEPAPQGRRLTPVVFVLAVLVLIASGVAAAGAFGMFAGRDRENRASIGPASATDAGAGRSDPADPEATTEPVEAAEPAPVILELTATPTEATFWLGDAPVKGNPARIERAPSKTRHKLLVKAEGYQTKEREISFDVSQRLEIALIPLEAESKSGTPSRSRDGKRPRRPEKGKGPSRHVLFTTELPE